MFAFPPLRNASINLSIEFSILQPYIITLVISVSHRNVQKRNFKIRNDWKNNYKKSKKTSKRWIKDIYKNSKKKQRNNVNRNVIVKKLMIYLIVNLIVYHNIVLYQNQQSSFTRESIEIHKNFDDLWWF